MSRVCRSVKVEPSVTMYCSVCTSVLSIVGSYTSESTPPATVNHTLDVVLRAVPRQSLRARSKCDSAPGPSGATLRGVLPAPEATPRTTHVAAANATPASRLREDETLIGLEGGDATSRTRRPQPGRCSARSAALCAGKQRGLL